MKRLAAVIVALGCLAVGGTFVVAGVLKSLDVDGFARDIALHGIIGPGLSAVAARLLVPFEIVVGVAAIIGYRRRLALILLSLALIGFIAGTGWAWAHGNTEGCGCFGRYAARTPREVIVEDLLLLGAAGLALVAMQLRPADRSIGSAPGQPAKASMTRGRAKPVVITALAVLTTAFALASPRLPLDGLATALHVGAPLNDLGLAQIAGNLAEGDRLLVILVLDEPASQGAVTELNALAAIPGVPPMTGLTSAPEDKRSEFFFSYAPSFEILEVPSADLRRLYRRAPRAFRVHNGLVTQVWTGIPPAQELAR